MALGPGKYDDLATLCMIETNAAAVVLIVIGGNRGSGMSGKEQRVDFDIAMRPMRVLKQKLPALLRDVATRIENEPDDAFNV